MKCPKCDGELKVVRTLVDRDYINIDIVCEKDEGHCFWSRLYEDDLKEEN